MGIAPSEITAPQAFFNRREILAAGLAAAAGTAVASAAPVTQPAGKSLRYTRNPRYSISSAPNSFEDITSHNNFYELGTGTSAPKRNAASLQTRPWSVTIAGEAELTGTFTLEDILAPHALEERIYRFRCVERWSMVIPWLGFPLSTMLKRFKPTSRAKYVEFTTLFDPRQMPGQRYAVLDWPYLEGLRMDEAMHPLTLMVTGVYGRILPNQNGAPLRLIVPWKYGFKSIKSIVRIRFSEQAPRTSWNLLAPDEYGFYANVHPEVDHPRWSQAKERRIGASWLTARRSTLLFNGYTDQVAGLYRGMDLRRFF